MGVAPKMPKLQADASGETPGGGGGGGAQTGPVVKLHVLAPGDRALPNVSCAPVVMVAVYRVEIRRGNVGVNVAVLFEVT